MQGPYSRKYGVQTKIVFTLYEVDGVDLKTDAVHAAGDTTIMKDEGAEANTVNGFADEGQGYSITLSAAEMQAARIVIYVVDQTANKVWLDTAIVVETYGHASAQHAFDLGTDAATAVLDGAREDHDVANSVGEGINHAAAMAAQKKLIEHDLANKTTVYKLDGGTTRFTLTPTQDAANNQTTITPGP